VTQDAPLTFFEHPILNSPCAHPARHWELDARWAFAEFRSAYCLEANLDAPVTGAVVVAETS
jgi:hypothetical protein